MNNQPIPTQKQREAYRHLKDPKKNYIFYGGAAGGGKSFLGCQWLQQCGYYLPGTRWFIGRNNLVDTRESVLVTWHKVAKMHDFNLFKVHDNKIRFRNGSEILFLDLTFYPQKDPMYERLGSKEYTGGWIEETGEVHEKAFDVLKSRIGRHLNKELELTPKMLLTGNPKKNWTYYTFYVPHKKDELPGNYAFIKAMHQDNPYLPTDYIKMLQEIKDPVLRARLLLGEWEYDDDPNALVAYAAIQDLWTNSFVERGKPAITADIALHGSDKFIVAVWMGHHLVEWIVLPKSSGKDVLTVIKNAAVRYKVPNSRITFDSDGVGGFLGGSTGFLPGSLPFHAQGKAKDDKNYATIKDECGYKLAERINNAGVFLETVQYKDEVVKELEQLKNKDVDKEGRLRLMPKEDIKLNIGHSPDFLDNLIMREFIEIKSKPPMVMVHRS